LGPEQETADGKWSGHAERVDTSTDPDVEALYSASCSSAGILYGFHTEVAVTEINGYWDDGGDKAPPFRRSADSTGRAQPMDSLDHPAVSVAIDALTAADQGLTPVSAVVRAEIAAVVIDGDQGRYIVFVHSDGDQWTTRGTMFGAPRPAGLRHNHTMAWEPLERLGTRFRSQTADRTGEGWFAVIGRAAQDAVSLSVASTLEEHSAPIGLAFAVIRATGSEQPRITVTTRDGQRVTARPLAA
jgi:hypothetical protein